MKAYEYEAIGVDNCQYFPGRSCYGSDWDQVFVGSNSSENEALSDALESAVTSEALTSDQADEIEKAIRKDRWGDGVDMDLTVEDLVAPDDVEDQDEWEEISEDLYFYVALYL